MDYPYRYYTMTAEEQSEYLEAENVKLRVDLARLRVALEAVLDAVNLGDGLARAMANARRALNPEPFGVPKDSGHAT